jgi:hypothetical protein
MPQGLPPQLLRLSLLGRRVYPWETLQEIRLD